MASMTALVALWMPSRERHRIRPGGDHPQALAINRLGQHGGRGRSVAGDLVGLAGGFFDQLGGQVLVGVVERDILGDGHAVLGSPWGRPSPCPARRCDRGAPTCYARREPTWSPPAANGCRASSSKTICFATADSSCCWREYQKVGWALPTKMANACMVGKAHPTKSRRPYNDNIVTIGSRPSYSAFVLQAACQERRLFRNPLH